MNSKRKVNKGLIIILLLFILYLLFLYGKASGKYNYSETNKMILTKEAMERFEEDISLGKDTTINDYIEIDDTDYRSKVSVLAYKIGEVSKKIFISTFKIFIDIMEKLFI